MIKNISSSTFRNLQEVVRLRRVSTLIGTLMFLATSLLAYILAPDLMLEGLTIRKAVTIPLFLIALWMVYNPKRKNVFPVLVASLGLIATISVIIGMIQFQGHTQFVYPITIMFTILWTYICAGVEVRISLVYNLVIIASFFFADLIYLNYPIYIRSVYWLITICFSVLGFTSAYLIQKAFLSSHYQKEEAKMAKEQLQIILDKKTMTFINTAHEIKTPLTVIHNYIVNYAKGKEDSEELGLILENFQRLERDIINFLTLEKEIHLTKDNKKNKHILVQDYFKEMQPLLVQYLNRKSIRISIQYSDRIILAISSKDFSHIVLNLVENAYKYSEKNTHVEISFELDSSGCPVMTVKDQGIGIPLEKQGDIFQPYVQIEQGKKQSQGLGMGLAIVKTIMTNCKGSIDVQSDGIHGSEFILRFPSVSSIPIDKLDKDYNEIRSPLFQRESILPTDDIQLDPNKKTIMIVEDNIDLLAMLKKSFDDTYNVLTACNGSIALEKISERGMVDLILSDVMMDETDGISLMKTLLEMYPEEIPPVIFLSANDIDEVRLEALSIGALDYIRKPFKMDELILKVKRWIQIFHNQQDIHWEVLCNQYELSERELDVLKLIVKGESRNKMAEGLFISINTVKTHIGNIYRKFEAKDRGHLLDIVYDFENSKINSL